MMSEESACQNLTTVTVSHRLAKKDEATILPTQVTISMANERLGQMSEVVFSIQEGSFYNCVMPGMVLCWCCAVLAANLTLIIDSH